MANAILTHLELVRNLSEEAGATLLAAARRRQKEASDGIIGGPP